MSAPVPGFQQTVTHKGHLEDVSAYTCVYMNEHVSCFFIHKFTDGNEGGGLCVKRQKNNAGYESFRRAA